MSPEDKAAMKEIVLRAPALPVAWCDGCGRPLYIPHIDVPGIRCHWCSEGAIAYRVPAEEWK